jgi:hypothetical protein
MKGKRQSADDGADGIAGGTLSRRKVLGGIGGLAAIPVLVGLSAAVPAAAATASTAARPGSVSTGDATAAGGGLVRGAERRYNARQLAEGTRLLLPTGIKAVSIQDYYDHPHSASIEADWPYLTAADGSTVDASVIPARGAPTRVAILSNFSEGWYELIHANGRADRVTWDVRKFPVLRFYGEFGATKEAPYQDRFYTLALQPLSHNPYSRSTSAR